MRPPWSAAFGDLIAPYYTDYSFAPGTAQEVSFLVQQGLVGPGMRVLDVGCGVGRHAVALARLGCDVTGIDCSAGLIAAAQRLASDPAVASADDHDLEQVMGQGIAQTNDVDARLTFLQMDARELPFVGLFDLALSVSQGAFGTSDTIEDDLTVLSTIRRSLKPGGTLLLTVTSVVGLIVGLATLPDANRRELPIDLGTMTSRATSVVDPEGMIVELETVSRAYTATELRLLCQQAGLRVVHVYGCGPGVWHGEPLALDHPDLMIVAQTP